MVEQGIADAQGAFAPAMEPMRGCRIPKITHIRACGVHVCRMEKCTLRGLRPVRNPTQNVPKAAFPLELTLRTFVVYTQTKPGKLWDATRGPQGAQECLICTHRTPSVRRSEGIPPYLSTRVNDYLESTSRMTYRNNPYVLLTPTRLLIYIAGGLLAHQSRANGDAPRRILLSHHDGPPLATRSRLGPPAPLTSRVFNPTCTVHRYRGVNVRDAATALHGHGRRPVRRG